MCYDPPHPSLVVYLSYYGKSNVTTNKKGESSNIHGICCLQMCLCFDLKLVNDIFLNFNFANSRTKLQ